MFPIHFVVGGAIGSIATYIYKDEQAKQWLVKTGKNLKEGTSSFIASFRKKPEEAAVETTSKAGEVVDAVVEKAEAAT
jgi:hypothetical protein